MSVTINGPKRRTLTLANLGERIRVTDAGCMEWIGAINKFGYGWVKVAGHVTLAHRAVWALEHGVIPDGLQVLHRCDNPPCVNPEHLFLGTHADNMRDAAGKGRNVSQRHPEKHWGELNSRARLTVADIHEIRRAVASESQAVVGRRFGISQRHVSDIVARRRWAHV